ncbi:MAG TPA: YbhB/YbcL family Raf kinase inhibitor-like protein [Vicinamibacterales bacterium]|jgi:Raf kinase inhibitor-like YbhB/YbcL family protein|nr:YbhB/YbcL family Raf kinase inhibitor-like protein [Vicinamibacterales bacterium]
MRAMRSSLGMLAILAIAASAAAQAPAGQRGAAAAAPAMTLTIDGFPDGGQIPVKFSQAAEGVATGEGHSPAISWANVPAGTQSFVLNMHDEDVARNKTTDDQAHWVVWNIPSDATGLPADVPKGSSRPDGSFQISATGPMYRGPGAGANGPYHHYMFEIYALDTKLDVQPTADAFATRANVMKAMQGHVLGKAVYGGLFKRPK